MSKTGQSHDALEGQNVATDFFGLSGTKFGTESKQPVETVRSGGDAEDVSNDVVEVPVEVSQELKQPGVTVKKAEKPEEVKAENITKDVSQVVQSLIDADILLFDENKEYDDSPEVLKELIVETKNKAFESGKNSFKEEYPEAKELLEVLEKGGSIQDYLEMSNEIDYSQVPLKDGDKPYVENQRNLIEDWMTVQGHDEDEIEETIAAYEKAGVLETQAGMAQRKLTTWQKKEKDSKLEKISTDSKTRQEVADRSREDFEKRILSVRNIKGFEISEKKAIELRDYLMKPLSKKGETKFKQDDTEENRLLYAYLSMTKFDKDALSREEGTKASLKLKKTINNVTDPHATPKRGASDVVRSGQSTSSTIPWAFAG